jgi:hypothetical protein
MRYSILIFLITSSLYSQETNIPTLSFNTRTQVKIDKTNPEFSAYLNEPEISFDEIKKYSQIISNLLENLDGFKIIDGKSDILNNSLPLLKEASKYASDGGFSKEIYNAIAMDKQSKNMALSYNQEIKKLKRDVNDLKWSRSVDSKFSALDMPFQTKNNGEALQYKFIEKEKDYKLNSYDEDLQDAKKQINRLNMTIVAEKEQARINLQKAIIVNFIDKRYEHTMIACAYYRLMYQDGGGQLKLESYLIEEASKNAKKLLSPSKISSENLSASQFNLDNKNNNEEKDKNNNESISAGQVNKQKYTASGIKTMLPEVTDTIDSINSNRLNAIAYMPTTITEVETASQKEINKGNKYISAFYRSISQNNFKNALFFLKKAYDVSGTLSSVQCVPFEYKEQLAIFDSNDLKLNLIDTNNKP